MRGRKPVGQHIDLGLAILAATQKPPHTHDTIAAFCGCSHQRIQQIEAGALRKLRFRLSRNPEILEALKEMATR